MRVASTANASSLLRMLSSPRARRPCETVCSQVRILSSEPALVGQYHASPQRNGTVEHIAVSPLSARQGPGPSAPCGLRPPPSAKGPRGPLHGIPVLVKDNIATADRMATTAGSLALLGAKPPADAVIVGRLRAAGAVIIGKANLSEWANFRSSNSSSGWSARGGQCKNPYALDRSPCGSSSGTAAAIAANFGAVGVGTETDGSIVCPAAACSLVGIKPTLGLVSRTGIVPIAHSQDTAGPMARTVRHAALLPGARAGAGRKDAATT